AGGRGTGAGEMRRGWSETAVERRISLALLAGWLLKALAAECEALPMGPWDLKAVSSAGRGAHHLGLPAANFAALALRGIAPRKSRQITAAKETTDVQLPLAAKIGKTRVVRIGAKVNCHFWGSFTVVKKGEATLPML